MLNWIFLFLIVSATFAAAFNGSMDAVTRAGIDSAKTAVELAIGLIGQMALWLGMMRILQDGGFLASLSRGVSKVLSKIFPEIPAGHPAMAAMVLNMGANILGLANAATPFGLKAMRELDTLNERKGVASNSMALFLAIGTSGVAVLPLGVIAVRGAQGSAEPAAIIIPSILATACSTIVGVTIAKLLERLPRFAVERFEIDHAATTAEPIKGLEDAVAMAAVDRPSEGWHRAILPTFFLLLLGALVHHFYEVGRFDFAAVKGMLSGWLLPTLMAFILVAGWSRKVHVYESFISGAKEGFDIAVMIIPFLVGILVAIGVFRASGLLGVITTAVAPATALIGMPAETLPMALIRPLSGSGALTVLMDTLQNSGPDSFPGFVVSVMNGSTETTFYVLAVYFGSIGIRAARHTVWACLAADLTGVLMAVWLSHVFF